MQGRDFNMPPLEWVCAFEAAARCGSFTAAATERGLTQPAISQQIGKLEKRLGAALFHRRARSITLSVEGEAWLPHVQRALGGLLESSEALFGAARSPLTISASQSIIELWLLPRLERLEGASGGRVSIKTMVLGAHDAPVDDIIRIRYGAGDWPHAHKLQLYQENIAPVAAPVLAARGGIWTDWPRIACAGPRPGWNDWASQFDVPTTPVPHLRFDTFLSALSAARAGRGVLLASLPLCEADLAAGRLVQIDENLLQHHESYWVLAGQGAVARAQWDSVIKALC